MPVSECFPTATAVIVAGWTTPANAYAFDNAYTYSETTTAEQEYLGYYGMPAGTEIIDKVFIRLKWKSTITTLNQGDTATGVCTLNVYNGATWQSYQVTTQVLSVTTVNDESFVATAGDDTNESTLIDVTTFINTLAKLASIKTRLLFTVAVAAGVTVRWSVDAVSVLICHHSEGGAYISATTERDLDKKEYRAVRKVKKYLEATSSHQ
jgi:hypothetical protein